MNSAALNARTASAAQPPPQVTCHACKCRQLLARRVPPAQRQVECNAIAPETLQDIIVGGAVLGAVSVALYSGLKKDPVPCSLCQGTGGIKCFACGGDGRNATVSRDDLYDSKAALGGGAAPPKRDPLGRTINPRDCKVCRGAGLVLCSQCKGSGFQSSF